MKLKFLATAACLALATASAFANDQITSTVYPGTPTPIIVNNGIPSGTIQLWYTYVGNSFPCGQFATFNLSLLDVLGTNGQHATYPVTLNLTQSGSGTPVQLTPDPSTLSVSGGGTTSTLVNVSISDCNNLPSTDGADIVGNLNDSSSDPQLGTISTIQVHIKLAFPTAACLKLYSFVTDEDNGALLDTVSLVEKTKSGTTTIINSTPGEISADGMVVNTCPDAQTFDIRVGLDHDWSTQPSNNPGNATFTYDLSGELNPYVAFTAPTSGGTAQGQALCIQNVTLASGDSYLETVHSQFNSGTLVSSLPTNPNQFTFSSTLSTATAAPTTCGSGTLLQNVSADPPLTYTIQ